MKTLKKTLKDLWNDESGQGATEYILLLVVVVAIALLFRKQIQETIETKLNDLGTAISGFNINQ